MKRRDDTTKQYRSPVMASIQETAEGLHAAGVMDKQTLKAVRRACGDGADEAGKEPR